TTVWSMRNVLYFIVFLCGGRGLKSWVYVIVALLVVSILVSRLYFRIFSFFSFFVILFFFFFFQAEDGIRDYKVTGVQTCALPILRASFAIVIDAIVKA